MSSQVQNYPLFTSSVHFNNTTKLNLSSTSESEDSDSDCDYVKIRTVSESSDDFVVFESSHQDEHENEYSDESDNETSDEESDQKLQYDDYVNSIIFNRNTVIQVDKDEDTCQKKVKFNLKPEIHLMVKWTYAYRTARIGHWERVARDRFRFKERISKTEKTLGYIFNIQHRLQVWEQRFQTEDCK